jgi:hypothetical protein
MLMMIKDNLNVYPIITIIHNLNPSLTKLKYRIMKIIEIMKTTSKKKMKPVVYYDNL